MNCTNSYDVKEVIPELVQLAKFSKQHVPEEHPKVGKGMTGSEGGKLYYRTAREVGRTVSDVQAPCLCVWEDLVEDAEELKRITVSFPH